MAIGELVLQLLDVTNERYARLYSTSWRPCRWPARSQATASARGAQAWPSHSGPQTQGPDSQPATAIGAGVALHLLDAAEALALLAASWRRAAGQRDLRQRPGRLQLVGDWPDRCRPRVLRTGSAAGDIGRYRPSASTGRRGQREVCARRSISWGPRRWPA